MTRINYFRTLANESNNKEMEKSLKVKKEIIENWLLHLHHDDDHPTKAEINTYVEEDHVDEIIQSGYYDLTGMHWGELENQINTLIEVIDKNNDISINNDLCGILHLLYNIQNHGEENLNVESKTK